jgi:ceramide glucosyltransferase
VLEIVFTAFVAPAVLLALFSMRSGRNLLDHVEVEIKGEPDPDELEYGPPATLILPVRGVDFGLAQNLRALADQSYSDHELIIVARDEDDPALALARMTLGDRARYVIAGPPPADRGEKIHNLLAAVAAARPESAVFAFADSDGQVTPDWMTNLIQPLGDEQVGATTGFRWYFPEEGGFWSLLRSAWDSTIVGRLSADDNKNFAWGGAMAIRRETFESAHVADYWQSSISDDYRLAQAVHDANLGVRFVPAAMVGAPGECTREEFLDWATRQITITKVYNRSLWTIGLIAHIIYCGAMVTSVLTLLTGDLLGLGGLVLVLVPGMAQGATRGYVGTMMFPERQEWFDRHVSIYFWMTPLATWVWLYAFLASAMTNRIRWRDYEYELLASDRTRLIRGPDDNA